MADPRRGRAHDALRDGGFLTLANGPVTADFFSSYSALDELRESCIEAFAFMQGPRNRGWLGCGAA